MKFNINWEVIYKELCKKPALLYRRILISGEWQKRGQFWDVSALGPVYSKGSIIFLSYISSALPYVDVSSSLRIFCWFCWGCFSKALTRELVRGVQQKMKQNKLISCSTEPNVPTSQRFFHLESVKLFIKWVLFLWELWWWLVLLWKTFLADLQYPWRSYGPGILGIICDFIYLFFLPKLKHLVKELLKIGILRWGIQKHLLILETLAYSIKFLQQSKSTVLKWILFPKS